MSAKPQAIVAASIVLGVLGALIILYLNIGKAGSDKQVAQLKTSLYRISGLHQEATTELREARSVIDKLESEIVYQRTIIDDLEGFLAASRRELDTLKGQVDKDREFISGLSERVANGQEIIDYLIEYLSD